MPRAASPRHPSSPSIASDMVDRSPPATRRRARTTSSAATAAHVDQPKHRDSFSYSEATMSMHGSDEWDESIDGSPGPGQGEKTKRRKRKDEPMSPVTVVSYVIFFYIIWQILTRSDENEILSHLPPSSLLAHHVDMHGTVQQPYHLPYHLPPIPQIAPQSAETAVPLWRMILAVAIYPVYFAITLLATPLPLLLNAVHLVLTILNTLLYPFTSTARVIIKTFVLGPLAVVKNILAVLYPLYVFVGGVVGVGCVMGMGAGWIGKVGLEWVLRRRDRRARSKRSASGGGGGAFTNRDRSTRLKSTSKDRAAALAEMPSQPIRAAVPLKSREKMAIVDDDDDNGGEGWYYHPGTAIMDEVEYLLPQFPKSGKSKSRSIDAYRVVPIARGTAREPVVLGTRRRGHRDEWSQVF